VDILIIFNVLISKVLPIFTGITPKQGE